MLPLLTTTAYFPPLTWFLAAADRSGWYLQGGENYQKGSWRNRCRIGTANGPLLLSIPLEGGKHQQMPIREVRISYTTNWVRTHEQTIQSAYGRAPYYEHYASLIFAPARRRPPTLWQLNRELMEAVAPLVGLPTPPEALETFVPTDATGYDRPENIPAYNPLYPQVFSDRFGFTPDLSVLDALFCLGPATLLK